MKEGQTSQAVSDLDSTSRAGLDNHVLCSSKSVVIRPKKMSYVAYHPPKMRVFFVENLRNSLGQRTDCLSIINLIPLWPLNF